MTQLHLENGMRLFYEVRPASGLVASAVLVTAGAEHETPATNGAAHFLEHLLFDGTQSRTQQELAHDFDLIGAYSNATTRRDHVAYLVVAGGEDLDRALELQADMLLHSTLPPDQFEKERGVIREEIAKDSSAPDAAAEAALAELLASGGAKELPILGTQASIAALTRDQVLDYYHRYYVPASMTLLVLGDFAPPALEAAVERRFGSKVSRSETITEGTRQAPAVPPVGRYQRPLSNDRIEVRLRIAVADSAVRSLSTLKLVTELLNSESGLAAALRTAPEIKGVEASAALPYVSGHWWFEIAAAGDTTIQVQAVHQRLVAALRAIAADVREDELAIARTRREVAAMIAADEIHYVAFMRADQILHEPFVFMADEAKALAATDPAAVEAAARSLLAGRAVLAAVGPGLPPIADDHNPLDVASADLRSAAADTAARAGVDPAPAGPDWQRVTIARPPVLKTFPNGLTAIVVSAPESEVFAIQLCARGRTFCEPPNKSGVADLLHRMLLRGAGGMSEEALGRELDRAGIRLKLTDDPRIPYDDYQTTQTSSFIRLETVDRFGPAAIHLLSEMVQAPELSADAFSDVRRQAVLEAERRAASPADQSQMLLRQQLFGTSPGARPALGTVADLRGMTIEDLRSFHAQYFAPSNLILAVATGIEPDAVLASIGAILGGAPGGAGPAVAPPARCAQPAAMRPEPTHAPSRREQLMAKDQSWIRLGTVLDPKPADLPALEVATLVLSDRMMAELREQRGLAYSVGASLSRGGDRAWLTAGMGTRPDSLAVAEAGLTAEIRELSRAKISADEVTRVVKIYQGRQRMRRLTRINQAQAMSLDVLAGDPPGATEQALMALARVSPADVERVARTYFAPAPLVTAIAR
jgi:zinc protease